MKTEDVKSGQFFKFKKRKSIYVMGFDFFATCISQQRRGKVIDCDEFVEREVILVKIIDFVEEL